VNFCPNCGTQIVGAGAFCANCGSPVRQSTPVASVSDPYLPPVVVPPVTLASAAGGFQGTQWPVAEPAPNQGIPEVVMGPSFDPTRDCLNCGSTMGVQTACPLCGAQRHG
jgi:predicted amidophosphoribosyltransferase